MLLKHEVRVNGEYFYGDIALNEKSYEFKLTDCYYSGGSKFESDKLREFAKELIDIANELDRLNSPKVVYRG